MYKKIFTWYFYISLEQKSFKKPKCQVSHFNSMAGCDSLKIKIKIKKRHPHPHTHTPHPKNTCTHMTHHQAPLWKCSRGQTQEGLAPTPKGIHNSSNHRLDTVNQFFKRFRELIWGFGQEHWYTICEGIQTWMVKRLWSSKKFLL